MYRPDPHSYPLLTVHPLLFNGRERAAGAPLPPRVMLFGLYKNRLSPKWREIRQFSLSFPATVDDDNRRQKPHRMSPQMYDTRMGPSTVVDDQP